MELVQFCYDPHNKNAVITLCDADIASYLAREHQILHICFLEDLPRVPMTGFASCDYDDVWKIDIRQFEDFYSPFHFGRCKLPRWLKGGVVKGDTVQVQTRFKANVLYFRLGKNRKDWTPTFCTEFDPAFKVVFVVESAKENFCVIRDELYLDYILCGPPRSRLYCRCCEYYRDRVVVAQCGHYMCIACWKNWDGSRPQTKCWICSAIVKRCVTARFRDSPCPIDHCRSGSSERNFVLVPCGCVVRCVNEPDKEGKLVCPYELCGRAAEEKWALYD